MWKKHSKPNINICNNPRMNITSGMVLTVHNSIAAVDTCNNTVNMDSLLLPSLPLVYSKHLTAKQKN